MKNFRDQPKRCLFCNVADMPKYTGEKEINDPNLGGGSHEEKHEICNFLPDEKGRLFGYVHIRGKTPKMPLEKIAENDPTAKLELEKDPGKLKNVFVVWVAKPLQSGRIVVGWYEDAIVYSTYQEFKIPAQQKYVDKGLKKFLIQAKAEKSVVLGIGERNNSERRISVQSGLGGMPKQYPIWVGNSDYGQNLISEIWQYVKNRKSETSSQGSRGRMEGKLTIRERTVKEYERDWCNREECVRAYGYECQVCGFDFKKVYGDVGENFIHVHHINPLSSAVERKINPKKDLIPVCPNCHYMLHRNKDKKKPFSAKELKKKMNSQKTGNAVLKALAPDSSNSD